MLRAVGIAVCEAARVGLHRCPILLADTHIITDYETAYAERSALLGTSKASRHSLTRA